MNEWDLFDAMGKIEDDLRLRAIEQSPRDRGTWLLHAGKAAVILPLLAVNVLLIFVMHSLDTGGHAPEDTLPETHVIEQNISDGETTVSGDCMAFTVSRTETEDGICTVSLNVRDRTDEIHGMHLTAALYSGETLLQTICETDAADEGYYYVCNAAGEFTANSLPADCTLICTAECRAAAAKDTPVIEIIRLTEVLP